MCGKNNSLVINYPAGTYLQKVIVGADDQYDDKTDAALQLYVNGVYLTELDVKKAPGLSRLEYSVGSYVQNLTFKSVHKDGKAVGDETKIWKITTY